MPKITLSKDLFAEVRALYARCNRGSRVLLNVPDVRLATRRRISNFVDCERRTRNSRLIYLKAVSPRLRSSDDKLRELHASVCYGSFRMAFIYNRDGRAKEKEAGGKREVAIDPT